MTKLINKTLLTVIIGIFVAGLVNAAFNEYWKTVKDIIPRTDNNVSIGSDTKNVKEGWFDDITVTDSFSSYGLVSIISTSTPQFSMVQSVGGNYGTMGVASNGIMEFTDITGNYSLGDLASGGAGGYTNLTEFVDQTNWRVFYSDAAGDVTELALGSDGEYFKSNGASSAPTWDTPAGSSLFTDSGSFAYLTAFTDDLAIGTTDTRSGYALWINTDAQNLHIGNDIYAGNDIYSFQDIIIGIGSSSDDDAIKFDDGTEALIWDNDPGEFDLSDQLTILDTASPQLSLIDGSGIAKFGVTSGGILEFTDITGAYSLGDLAASGAGDITDVWDCSSGNCETLTAGASDILDATLGMIVLPVNGTVDAQGEITWDTTSGQLKIYDGSAIQVFVPEKEICFVLEDPVDGDDDIAFYFPRRAITITDVYCQVDGGTSIALVISDGTNALESITCDADGAEDDGSIANGAFTSLERMEFDLDAASGTNTWLNVCVTYTITGD